jgi:hypothetical protein
MCCVFSVLVTMKQNNDRQQLVTGILMCRDDVNDTAITIATDVV